MKLKGKTKKSEILSYLIPDQPFKTVAMDFLGPLKTGVNGSKHVLVIVDFLTRFLITVPTEDRTADTVMRALREQLFAPLNILEVILSDNAPEFRSNLLEECTCSYGVLLRFTTHTTPSQTAWQKME